MPSSENAAAAAAAPMVGHRRPVGSSSPRFQSSVASVVGGCRCSSVQQRMAGCLQHVQRSELQSHAACCAHSTTVALACATHWVGHSTSRVTNSKGTSRRLWQCHRARGSRRDCMAILSNWDRLELGCI